MGNTRTYRYVVREIESELYMVVDTQKARAIGSAFYMRDEAETLATILQAQWEDFMASNEEARSQVRHWLVEFLAPVVPYIGDHHEATLPIEVSIRQARYTIDELKERQKS